VKVKQWDFIFCSISAKRTLEVFMPFLREQWKDSAVKSKHKEEQEAQFKVTLFAENLFF